MLCLCEMRKILLLRHLVPENVSPPTSSQPLRLLGTQITLEVTAMDGKKK